MKYLDIQKQQSIAVVLIIFFSILAYLPIWSNGIVGFDTNGYVLENEKIRNFSWENLWWMLTTFHMSNWHPLTWLSYSIDYSLYELNPTGYLATNLALHILNSLLLLHIAEKIFQHLNLKWSLPAATVAALFFAVHPQHVEAVAWIAQRKELLCAFFMFGCIATYLKYVELGNAKNRTWYFLSIASAALALTAKPMAVTLPVILLILDVYPLGRTHWFRTENAKQAELKKLIIEKTPFIALSGAVSIITILAQGAGGAIASTENLGIGYRFLNAADSYLLYLTKWLLPINLSPFYEYENYQAFQISFVHIIPILAFVGIFFISALLWQKNKKHWLTAFVYYSVTVLPVIGLLQVGTQAAADRYTYIPLIPFYLIAGAGIVSLLSTKTKGVIIATGVLSLLIISPLVYLTYEQTKIWKNDLVFWQYTTLQSPKSGLVRHNYGVALYHSGDLEKAINEFNISLQIRQSALTNQWLGNAYFQKGELEKAKRNLLLSLKPDVDSRYVNKVEIFNKLARIFIQQKDQSTARKLALAAQKIDANNAETLEILALLR